MSAINYDNIPHAMPTTQSETCTID